MISFLFTSTPLKYLIQSLWRDEAFSYLLAKQNIFSLLTLTAKDFNPPLYYLTLKVWMFIFGSSEIALRSLSLLFYWATMYVIFLFFTEIFKFSTKKSLLYLLFFLCNPLLTYYAFEARMYTMFAFFATLSFYAYHQRKIGLYQIATILGLYTHYFMLLVVITQFFLALLFERGKNHFTFLLKKMFLPLIVFIPWLLFVVIEKPIARDSSFWIPLIHMKDILLIPGLLFTGYENELGFLTSSSLLWLSLILIGVCTFGYAKVHSEKTKERLHQFIFFAAWGLIPTLIIFLISFYEPLFLPRYLIFSNISLYLFFIASLEEFKPQPRIFFLFIVLALTLSYNSAQLKYRTKPEIDKTIREIKKLAGKNDLLYVTNELNFFTAQYYFDSERVFIYQKTYEELPAYVGKVLIPKDRIAKTIPTFPRKVFILRDETSYDIQSSY